MRIETIGNAKLYLGDCLTVLPELRADAVITDPPYGMGLNTDWSGMGGWYGTGRGRAHPEVCGDDKPFDPGPCLAVAKTCLFWGAQWFCHRLPISGGWLVFNKRGEGKASEISFGDAELAWCNRLNSVRLYSQMWHGVARWRWSEEGVHHPTQKPIGLMAWCIEQAGNPQVVLDPYMGSGTTGVAATSTGKKFIGVEVDPHYFDIACERIENAQRQEALFQ